jgi:hypothetical protein
METLKLTGMVIGVTAVAFAIALGLAALCHVLFDQPACEAQTRGLHMPHRWTFWGNCQVQTPQEGWIPLENLRVTAAARR